MRLGDDDMRTVHADAERQVGRSAATTPRIAARSNGAADKADYYRVNTATGERTLIDKTLSRTMGTSPDSKWFLYLKNKQVRAFNLETGARSSSWTRRPARAS